MNKVLVTGADGFIGSHLVECLMTLGYSVRAFCYYNSFNSWGWLDTLNSEQLNEIEIITGDIRDFNSVYLATKDIHTVFHLAALIAIPYSYTAASSYVDTNIQGTLNVLEACKMHDTSRVLITSTSEVYGTAKYVPIDESHPKQPQSPYAATKISADALALSYHNSFQLPISIVRPFNTFGPRQSARAIIPTVITQLLNGKSEINLGDLRPTRDLVFVKDTVDGYIAICNADALIGHEINIATNEEISIGALADKIIQRINPNAVIIEKAERIRPADSEVFRLLGSNEKIKTFTPWTPKLTFDQGLDLTIDWFSDPQNLIKYKANLYNV